MKRLEWARRRAAEAVGHSLSLLLLCLLTLATPSAGTAQEGCEFGPEGNDVLRQVTLTGGDAIFYVTRPHLVCEDGIQIWADSAVAFTSSDMAHLIGSVRYEDPARTLRAAEARYFSEVGRLQAEGELRVEDRDEGSVIEHGSLVYFRETSFRREESMTVTARQNEPRPTATVVDAGSSAERDTELVAPDFPSLEPSTEDDTRRVYVVTGDEILSRGGGYLRSIGSVELVSDSILAFSDTLEYEEAENRLVLRGSARVDAPDYDLRGASIELLTPEPAHREIRASRNAVLTGEDLELTAERIFLFARQDRLERLVALPPVKEDTVSSGPPEGDSIDSGPGRPRAVSDDLEITADSLEILAPGETLERLFAAGRARSVSTARDSLTTEQLPEVARTDWLEGDTIVVTFVPDTTSEVDGERRTRVDRIIASVSARSLYRLTPSDASAEAGVDPPAVHYVVGDRITIVMRDDEVERMEVEGQTVGVHLEPLPRDPDPEP
ncbi:MAG: hypothetical protein U5R14_07120 [Gemmatimonadota bacterium]|nr:hypothetical protein [Gemmatimonadota bacterium]